MEREVSLIQICVAVTILCTLGCEELRYGIKSNPDDDTDSSIISISRDDVSPDEIVNTGSVVITDADGNWGTDEYVLRAAAITDDTLRLTVSYSGGCEPHEFTLVTSGAFFESSPVRLPISVAHNANDDPCEAYPTEVYHFDLTGIKTLYQEAYQQEAGTIILLLENAPNGELVYHFAL